jgi:hypothetical protein
MAREMVMKLVLGVLFLMFVAAFPFVYMLVASI